MKKKKRYILSIGMLLIQIYAPLVVYGREVRSVETEGTIGFTGIYETPGTPEPAPEGTIKPVFPKEVAKNPSGFSPAMSRKLPKTNEQQGSIWTMFGFLIVIATLGFWFWKHKKKKIKKVGFK